MQNLASRAFARKNTNGTFWPAILLLVLLCASTAAPAAECRKTANVVESAQSVAKNTEKGGHVSIHVKGQKTEAGKSQFHSESDFTSAFTKWKNDTTNRPTPKNCGGSNAGVMDCVKASDVGISSAIVCNSVGSDQKCTSTTNITPEKVAFRYAKSSGKWILNTAYPSKNDSCS